MQIWGFGAVRICIGAKVNVLIQKSVQHFGAVRICIGAKAKTKVIVEASALEQYE